jgi:hypothetical protein
MAAAPSWKVYSDSGEYLASCKYPEHAAALVAALGVDGTTIRWVHVLTVWTEGVDGHAGESYDVVAEQCLKLVQARGLVK